MKNRRGMLLAEETLKMLIAVISIGFLIYFLTSLYLAKLNEQDKKHAEATIEKISLIIEGENNFEVVYDPTPEGWSLFGYVGEEVKPNSCAGKNCLCVCDDVTIDFGDRQLKECDKDGFCKIVLNLQNFDEIEIKQSPFAVEIKKDNKLGIVIIQEQ